MSRKKWQPSGEAHPNFRHGRYAGEKTRDRTETPRTLATHNLRLWIEKHVKVGEEFESSAAMDALEGRWNRRQIAYALRQLRRVGEIQGMGQGRHLSRNVRLK